MHRCGWLRSNPPRIAILAGPASQTTRQGRAQTLRPLATEYQGNPGNRPHIHNNHLGFAMHVPTLTDEELRRLIDTEPDNLDALKEGAMRFVTQGKSSDPEDLLREYTRGYSIGHDEGYEYGLETAADV